MPLLSLYQTTKLWQALKKVSFNKKSQVVSLLIPERDYLKRIRLRSGHIK